MRVALPCAGLRGRAGLPQLHRVPRVFQRCGLGDRPAGELLAGVAAQRAGAQRRYVLVQRARPTGPLRLSISVSTLQADASAWLSRMLFRLLTLKPWLRHVSCASDWTLAA